MKKTKPLASSLMKIKMPDIQNTKILAALIFVQLFAFSQLFAQLPEKSIPSPANLNGNHYPCVMPDNSVVFRIHAPDANLVQVNIRKLYDMEKDADGNWTVRTEPLDPGFHFYKMVIDGVSVVDPATKTFVGGGGVSSAVDIPEKGVDFYNIKDVPHGALSSKYYFSDYTENWRRLFVYTPPGYNENIGQKYPVVYIQHGGGEDETGWAVQGKTDIILDNLIAEGKAKEMIVVISNGNVQGKEDNNFLRGYSSAAMAPFKEEMIKNIVPFVDANFRTISNPENRAMCGLSMGGGQSFYIGLESPEVFASVGVFSTGLFGGLTEASSFDAETEMPGLLSNSDKFNKQLDLFYISCGEQDPRIKHTETAIRKMKESGLELEFNSFPGDHEWQVWRKSLHDFAQRVFQ